MISLEYATMRGVPPKKPRIELCSGSLEIQASPSKWLGECSRNPSVSVYQLALLWEAVWCLWIFFEDSFNMLAHFLMGDLQVYLPTLHWVFISSWPKASCPTLPIHTISPWVTFTFPGWKKSSKGSVFLIQKRWNNNNNKNSRSTKRHQNQQVQQLFWRKNSGEKVSIGVLHQMERTLKVTSI